MIKSRTIMHPRPWTVGLLAAGLMMGGQSAAHAQTVTEAEIANSLRLPQKTRSLSVGPPASGDDVVFLESLGGKTGHPLSEADREKLALIAGNKPSIDLDVPFAFGSADFTPKAKLALKRLGAVLSTPEFRDGTYVIAGHTDAKGTDALNKSLSERRAEAVRRYLVEKHGFARDRLIGVGYGKDHLKDASDPFADANRRVQATNVSEVKSASR